MLADDADWRGKRSQGLEKEGDGVKRKMCNIGLTGGEEEEERHTDRVEKYRHKNSTG